MITHKFPKEQEVSNETIKNSIIRSKYKNGLFIALYFGYSYHVPIGIRPDDILNNVASIWSKYILLNAEKFRDFFVGYAGKKELIYYSGGSYSDYRMPEFLNGLIDLIVKDQEDDKILWSINSNFTTTELNDKMVRAASTLASQKEYYEYGVSLLCGFSEVVLEGTEEDWNNLILAIENMPCPDDSLVSWRLNITHVIKNMIEGNEDFWQSCVVKHPYGSGGQSKKDGWITIFNPINENGDWITQIEDKDILDLTSDFDININDNGQEFTVKAVSGPVSVKLFDRLSVLNKTRFVRKHHLK
ncbi:MAG: DUF4419 domain-containing protein [Candidatus Lokiarchaeota archaeon]|nr:DUF4419 domain-containing protein [Candidatus Lokiarchaeota archaeon]